MDNYIRRLKIESLFTSGNDLIINFEEKINCIYGSNGTGKTTIINILVASLNLDIKQLSKLPFLKVSIFTAQTGKKRPQTFLDMEKNPNGDLIVTMHANKESDPIREIVSISRLEADFSENGTKKRLIEVIKNHLTITYVPLSRMQENETYDTNRPDEFWLSQVLKSRHLSSAEISDVIDPNRRMLKGIESLFRQRYTETQKKINDGLDNLKQTIIGRLLINEEDSTKLKQKRPNINLGQTPLSKFEEYSSKLKSASLNVEKVALEEHFHIIDDTLNTRAISAKNYINSSNPKEKQKYLNQYWEADLKYKALFPIHERLLSIIKDIELIGEQKKDLMFPFDYFESIVNTFLINKKFRFTNTGGFEIKSGERSIDLVDLSSGEKHMIALLGRVSLSPTNGAVFVADEPELSLHLEWQRKILPSILKLSPNIQIIVATHSPAIIPQQANQIDLEECYK